MVSIQQGATGGLNRLEKKIVKLLFEKKWRNQDILAFINQCRPVTVNPGRISDVKSDEKQTAATEEQLDDYLKFKKSFDLQTGLSPYVDERLVKSREAMKLAVSVFNNPSLRFRAENFSMLTIVAWTYLALEFAERNDLATERGNGKAISLADFIKMNECPFPEGVKNNLKAMIALRDQVEHRVLGGEDPSWFGIFQACCTNYDTWLTKIFGEDLTLAREMSLSLQFSGLNIGQATEMANTGLPPAIDSVNAEILNGMTEAEKNDLEFRFSVIYMTVASSKSEAVYKFIAPSSAEGLDISNVLVKHKPSAVTHPFKPMEVVALVAEKTGKVFTSHQHTQQWKNHQVRPNGDADNPEETNLDYCYYNPTFKAYTYNENWVDLICSEINV